MTSQRTRRSPMIPVSQELLSGKSLRLSRLYLLLVLISYAMVASHYTKPYPMNATLVYGQQRAHKLYFHSCGPSDKSRKEIKKL